MSDFKKKGLNPFALKRDTGKNNSLTKVNPNEKSYTEIRNVKSRDNGFQPNSNSSILGSTTLNDGKASLKNAVELLNLSIPHTSANHPLSSNDTDLIIQKQLLRTASLNTSHKPFGISSNNQLDMQLHPMPKFGKGPTSIHEGAFLANTSKVESNYDPLYDISDLLSMHYEQASHSGDSHTCFPPRTRFEELSYGLSTREDGDMSNLRKCVQDLKYCDLTLCDSDDLSQPIKNKYRFNDSNQYDNNQYISNQLSDHRNDSSDRNNPNRCRKRRQPWRNKMGGYNDNALNSMSLARKSSGGMKKTRTNPNGYQRNSNHYTKEYHMIDEYQPSSRTRMMGRKEERWNRNLTSYHDDIDKKYEIKDLPGSYSSFPTTDSYNMPYEDDYADYEGSYADELGIDEGLLDFNMWESI